MSTDARSRLEATVDQMVKVDHFPEGLVRLLEAKFPGASHADYEDAIATGFEKHAGRMFERAGSRTDVASAYGHPLERGGSGWWPSSFPP